MWTSKIRAGLFAAALVALLAPHGVDAQGRGHGRAVPPGHMPPPGACRVWYDNLPPGHQPPPTSCGAASREAYRTGGRVIYGGDSRSGGRGYAQRGPGACDERDYRRGECGYSGRYPDGRYPDGRYPDGRYPGARYPDGRYPQGYPDRTSRSSDIVDVIFGRSGEDRRYPEDRYPDERRERDGRVPERDAATILRDVILGRGGG